MIGKRRIYGLPRIFLEKAFKIFDVENSLFILYSYLLGFVNKKAGSWWFHSPALLEVFTKSIWLFVPIIRLLDRSFFSLIQ